MGASGGVGWRLEDSIGVRMELLSAAYSFEYSDSYPPPLRGGIGPVTRLDRSTEARITRPIQRDLGQEPREEDAGDGVDEVKHGSGGSRARV